MDKRNREYEKQETMLKKSEKTKNCLREVKNFQHVMEVRAMFIGLLKKIWYVSQ